MTSQPLSRRRALGAAAGIGVSLPVLAACSGAEESATATDPADGPAPDGAAPDGAGSNGADDPPADDASLTTVGDVPVGGGVILDDAEVVVTQPTEGDFRGFSAVCTHQGCLVREVTETIDCFCHGAKYSLETGEPVSGPANTPLAPRELTLDGERIVLA